MPDLTELSEVDSLSSLTIPSIHDQFLLHWIDVSDRFNGSWSQAENGENFKFISLWCRFQPHRNGEKTWQGNEGKGNANRESEHCPKSGFRNSRPISANSDQIFFCAGGQRQQRSVQRNRNLRKKLCFPSKGFFLSSGFRFILFPDYIWVRNVCCMPVSVLAANMTWSFAI